MVAGKARTNRGRGQCNDGRPASPRIDELCMLVGKILVADHEVVSKVGMCAELQRHMERSVPTHGGSGPQSRPGPESMSLLDMDKIPNVRVKENLQYLELYWNRMMEADQNAASYEEFYSHVIESHNGRNLVAHGAVVFSESTVKNVRNKRVFSKNGLLEQLELTRCALEDVNMICRYLGLVDYDEYMASAQAI